MVCCVCCLICLALAAGSSSSSSSSEGYEDEYSTDGDSDSESETDVPDKVLPQGALKGMLKRLGARAVLLVEQINRTPFRHSFQHDFATEDSGHSRKGDPPDTGSATASRGLAHRHGEESRRE